MLHVTEAMAGGIVTFTASISERQAEEGANVSVYYLRRPDSPSELDLASRFRQGVQLTNFSSESKVMSRLRLTITLWRVMQKGTFSAVHLHSSKAGFIGRLLYLMTTRRSRLFYSPHGFAFLRLDSSRFTKAATRAVESALAGVGQGLILTCASERQLAIDALRARKTFVVESGVDEKTVLAPSLEADESPVSVASTPDPARPIVACVARVTYQKGPWRFADVARRLGGVADFVWIGGGEADDEQKWLGGSNAQITGWLAPEDLAQMLKKVDILLFPSLWEGMPLSLIQAQAQGIPAIVSNVVGNKDAVLDGLTGYICDTDEELVEKTERLIHDPALRSQMSLSARNWAMENLTDRNLGRQTLAIYSGVNGND